MSKKSEEHKNEVESTTPAAIEVAIPSVPVSFTFKNEKLNNYSIEIATIRDELGNVNIKLAKVLGKVKTEKCYEDDGFTSVAEYAEKTFNIKRSMAYQLAAVGERFYNADSETAKKVADMLPPSNLSEIVKLTDEQIADQIENGTISENSTQASLREVASHVKEAEKPTKTRVLPQYVVDVIMFNENYHTRNHFDRITMEELPLEIGVTDPIIKTFIKPIDNGEIKVSGVDIMLTSDGTVIKIEYERYVTEVESKRKSRKNGHVKTYTRAELEAMLAALNDKEQGK